MRTALTRAGLCIAVGLAAGSHAAPAAAQTAALLADSIQAQTATATVAPAAVTPPPVDAVAPYIAPAPPDYPRGKISGYLFGDAYYNANGDPVHIYNATGGDLGSANIDGAKPITKDLNGIQLRRVYFQLDNDLSVRYATRLRLEMDSKALSSDGKVSAFVKNAYFQARSVIPRGDVLFGMLNTPTWENAEEFWQYRAIEKTLADFRGIGSASDIGVALKGFVDGDHHAGYNLMVGDGNGQKPETDRFKKVYFTLPLRFGELRLEPYVDAQSVRVNLTPKVASHTDSFAVNNDQATYKLFAGYEFHRFGVGAEGVVRIQHLGPAASREPRGASLFARGTLRPTLGAFARLDVWQPDHRAANRVDTRLWIAGVDWQPFKDVHVMPNVEAVQYVAHGTALAPTHADVQARITVYCRFSRPQS